MNWNEQYSQDNEPTLNDIKDFIKSGLWDDLNQFIISTYNIEPVITYSKCSAQRGWNVKYRKSSKSLCTLYPMDGYFIALIVIGNKEQTETELLMPSLSNYIQDLYNKTAFSAGGRWLMLKIDNKRVLDDVKELIKIRVKPKNN